MTHGENKYSCAFRGIITYKKGLRRILEQNRESDRCNVSPDITSE